MNQTRLNPGKNGSAVSRRKHPRHTILRPAHWDFYTEACGLKAGLIENLSEGGALLCATEPIDYRRWIRVTFREPDRCLWFVTIGRVLRREDRLESWQDERITLYRYGVEWVQPLNRSLLLSLQQGFAPCSLCGSKSTPISDPQGSGQIYCVTCHLRRACQNLLTHDFQSDALGDYQEKRLPDDSDTVA